MSRTPDFRELVGEDLPAGDRTSPERRRRVTGVVARGDTLYRAPAVVLTTGTFLKAVMHTGEAKTQGGRAGDSTGRVVLSASPCSPATRAPARSAPPDP